MALISLSLFAPLAAACGDDSSAPLDGSVPMDSTVPVDAALPDDSVALLEVHALDVWAQPLPAEGTMLTVTNDGAPVATSGLPLATIPLSAAGELAIRLEAEGHVPLAIAASFDGTGELDALVVGASEGPEPQGVSVSHEVRTISGRSVPVHTIHLGLRHRWFSAQGRPARRGNRVRLMTSGAEAWEQVASDLRTASDHVHAATWWWESNFELVRDAETHVSSSAAEREANTILGILDESPATKRVLVNQFVSQDGSISWVSSDAAIRSRGAAAGDDFEFMGQANETRGMFELAVAPFVFGERVRAAFPELASRAFDTESPIASTVPSRPVDLTEWPIMLDVPVASFHQKFMTVDGSVAFVGGMNLRRVDWDTDEHLVFEPRRMLFDATTEDRMAVAAHEELPDTGPRKDYMTRLEGPIVQDVEDIFHLRWASQLEAGADYAEHASDFEVPRAQAPIAGGVQAQLTATLPEPYAEHAIAETWWNAIENAEQYVFVEDQYFRVPMLLDLLVARMEEITDLQLVVITKPVDEIADPGCEWTYRMAQELRTRFPTRFHLFQLRSFDVQDVGWGIDETEERFTDMDVHSKLLIVDDVFLSVGSANKNNRGIVYEGELNVAVYDRAWVTEARRRVLSLVLPSGTTPADTAAGWVTQLEEAAAWNQSVWAQWDSESGDISLDGAPLPAEYTPHGFVYPLVFDVPSECLIEGVGPDMT